MQDGLNHKRYEYIQTLSNDVGKGYTLMLWQRCVDRLKALDWNGQVERMQITTIQT